MRKPKFSVRADVERIRFSIDHQGFDLRVIKCAGETKAAQLEHNRWMASMLRVALRRLQGAPKQRVVKRGRR